jgi:hypothetical protein
MPQCDHIILGASHDNGYIRILSKLETANVSPGKVILLQGPSFATELERFDTVLFPRVKFGDLFMDKKLEVGKKYSQIAADGFSPISRKTASPPMSPMFVPPKLGEPELSMTLGDFH